MRTPSLGHTVPQIGAPAAWQAGLTGAGVTVAVINSGVDQTTPASRARRSHRSGHGTHVASTIAGTGTRYAVWRQVPGCSTRRCSTTMGSPTMGSPTTRTSSPHCAGQRKGARTANLSLGAPDLPGTDPVEAVIEELSVSHGLLVVAAAGNSYRPESIGSPAATDAALAVGAVDGADELAPFSSRGPRAGDGR